MPMLVEAEKKWSGQRVRFIAVSLDDKQSVRNVESFVARYRVPFPVWTGASTATLDRLRLGEGMPDTIFLDENGLIYARVLGEIQRAELDQRLEWLLGGRCSTTCIGPVAGNETPPRVCLSYTERGVPIFDSSALVFTSDMRDDPRMMAPTDSVLAKRLVSCT
jgi:hypothetical protein